MSLDIGRRLGAFEITGVLGAGGMGQVYRARDTRLGREVALKFLPDDVLNDAERVARFRREAQVLASLNHPHIGAIHSVEEVDGRPFLVLELVEGGTLADLIAQASGSRLQASGAGRQATGLPLNQALAIAKQIADALEAAHEKGIVHRDLKPANIALSATGAVKVLDFGLAAFRAGHADQSSASRTDLTHSPTITSPAMTQAGVILGTAAYMAPEQAKGRPIDKRADVWAFGCVLYEMLTGAKAFAGEDVSDTLAAILRGDPNWTALPADLPESVRVLLKRCLEKDRHARISDIAAAKFVLAEGDTLIGRAVPPLPPMPSSSRRSSALVAAVLAAVAGTAAAAWYLRPQEPARPIMRFGLTLPSDLTVNPQGNDRDIAIAPDGSFVVYRSSVSGVSQFVVRAIDQLEPRALGEATEQTGQTSGVRSPFISPDGQWLGYQSRGELKKIPINGGASVTLCLLQGPLLGAAWGADDSIIFSAGGGGAALRAVSANGGEPRVLIAPDTSAGEISYAFPSFLPGGRQIVFAIVRAQPASATSVAAAQDIAVYDLDTGEKRILLRGGTSPQYLQTGHLVYSADGGLRAVRFDPDGLQVVGEAVTVLGSVYLSSIGLANAALSENGTLVYVPGTGNITAAPRSLSWVTRGGAEETINSPERPFNDPRVSPDGRQISLELTDASDDIWTFDVTRGALTRQTFEMAEDETPVWSPDGRWLAYSSTRGTDRLVLRRRADGSGSEETLLTTTSHIHIEQWSPDGRALLLAVNETGVPPDVAVMELDGDRILKPLLNTRFAEHSAHLSPDGRWIAYVSNESGASDVFVRAYPSLEGKWQISVGGGSQPVWSRSGNELFYRAAGSLMGVRVETNASSFVADPPVKLFDDRYHLKGASHVGYDVGPDGRFVFVKEMLNEDSDGGQSPLVVVINWTEALKQALPR